MGPVRAKAFIKTRTCPSSEDISSRRLPRGKSDQITRHIAGCEFCAAEQIFLSAFSPTTEEYEPAEMPVHLRRLAEALLMELADFRISTGSPLTRAGASHWNLNLRVRNLVR